MELPPIDLQCGMSHFTVVTCNREPRRMNRGLRMEVTTMDKAFISTIMRSKDFHIINGRTKNFR